MDFGIPSGGNNDDRVNNLISSIIQQKIPNYVNNYMWHIIRK